MNCVHSFGSVRFVVMYPAVIAGAIAMSRLCPDMPVEDFLKVIDDITPYVEPNKVLVIFTGGEALVRKDIEKCGLELYRRGYPWGIVSNGYLMTRERLDSLLASGLHSATIT